jgi:hypothetical protein
VHELGKCVGITPDDPLALNEDTGLALAGNEPQLIDGEI